MFQGKYPRLSYYLSLFTLENGLDLQQIRGIVRKAVITNPSLVNEIAAAFADGGVRWREVLDDPQVGEIYPTESEAEALSYARRMLLLEDESNVKP